MGPESPEDEARTAPEPNGAGSGPSRSRAPLRLSDLDPRERRRALLRAVATITLFWVLVLGAFYLVPFSHLSGGDSVLRLVVVVALVGVVLVLQIRRISNAELPELRAVEALAVVIVVFLTGFSIVYLNLAHGAESTFSQPLDHTRALYFTISVFSTVGFGDITPRTDTARLIVSAQMLLDLVIVGTVVRLIFNAARTRIGPGQVSPRSGVDGAEL
jgi:voltage-gated potassium channel